MSTHLRPPTALPDPIHEPSVFLAGSIEQGVAQDWQSLFVQALSPLDVLIFNPRREAWDASWVQSIDNPEFRQQVEWELQALEQANVIALYLDPSTRSPISMLELGLFAHTNKLIVCCPEGFWRKGNIDIVCARYHIEQATTLDELILKTQQRLRAFSL